MRKKCLIFLINQSIDKMSREGQQDDESGLSNRVFMDKINFFFLFLTILLINLVALGKVNSNLAFVAAIYENKVDIKTPTIATKEKTIILKNESFSKLYGKVIQDNGELIEFFTVQSKKQFVGNYKLDDKNSYLFVIFLSPAIHEIKLKEGMSYEIPSRR